MGCLLCGITTTVTAMPSIPEPSLTAERIIPRRERAARPTHETHPVTDSCTTTSKFIKPAVRDAGAGVTHTGRPFTAIGYAEVMTLALQPADAVRLVLGRAHAVGWSPLNRTQVVTLLYFVDLQAVNDIGYPLTTIDWHWDRYGPFSADISSEIDRLTNDRSIEALPMDPDATVAEHRYVLSSTDVASDPSAAAVVDRVVAAHRGETTTQLRDASYQTAPMLRVQLHGERGDELDLFADTEHEREAMRYLVETRMPDDFRAGEALGVLASRQHERT